MKIHIVQKGDTLWEIAEQYGVDFSELKQLNSQLSSPDMIMPGMKVKIPSTKKQVKKETKQSNEKMNKKYSPKPIGMLEEDDGKVTKEMKQENMHVEKENVVEKDQLMKMKKMPDIKQPNMQMPVMEQEIKMKKQKEQEKPKKPKKPEYEEKKQEKQMNDSHMLAHHHPPMPVMPACCCCCPSYPQHFMLHQQGMHKMQGVQMQPMHSGKQMGMSPSHMTQMPPNMQQAPPPNIQQMPPIMQQVPPNIQQMPPTMQQVPLNMQQMPPTMPQMPPTIKHKPTNCSCQNELPAHMNYTYLPYQGMRYEPTFSDPVQMHHHTSISEPLNDQMEETVNSDPMANPTPPLYPQYENDYNEEE